MRVYRPAYKRSQRIEVLLTDHRGRNELSVLLLAQITKYIEVEIVKLIC